jgi:hypothetical protein
LYKTRSKKTEREKGEERQGEKRRGQTETDGETQTPRQRNTDRLIMRITKMGGG